MIRTFDEWLDTQIPLAANADSSEAIEQMRNAWNAAITSGADEFAERKEELLLKYDAPIRISIGEAAKLVPPTMALNLNESFAARYPSREAAEEWQQLNLDHYGHEAVGIVEDPVHGGFVGVMSYRKMLARLRSQRT